MTLDELREKAEQERNAQRRFVHSLRVCVAAGCLSAHSDDLKSALERELTQARLTETCKVKAVGCMGLCSAGPLVSVEPAGPLYQGATPADAPEIVHGLSATPVERLECPRNLPFFARQLNLVLENSGRIDPEKIEEYIAAGGYEALVRWLWSTECSKRPAVRRLLDTL